MTKLLAVFIVAFTSFEMSSSYFLPQIDQTVVVINQELEFWANYFNQNFYQIDVVNFMSYSSYLGSVASASSDTPAKAHIITRRGNYSSFVQDLAAMIVATRAAVTADIISKQETVFDKADDINPVAIEINHNLRNKRKCSLNQANAFYDFYAAEIQNLALSEINNARQSYERLILRSYIPTYLIQDLFDKFHACLVEPTEVLDCVRKAEDFYMQFTKNMIKMSLDSFELSMATLNYRIERAIVNDVDIFKYDAYKNSTTYSCPATVV